MAKITKVELTEQEAEKRFCPYSGPDGDKHCWGADCMAWRWTGQFGLHLDGKVEPLGYCGLAGDPRRQRAS